MSALEGKRHGMLASENRKIVGKIDDVKGTVYFCKVAIYYTTYLVSLILLGAKLD